MYLNDLITSVNDAVWGYVLIFALVGCGIWFTIKTRFVQFRMVGEMLRLLTDSAVNTVEEQVKEQKAGEKSKHISSFQAFAVSVATRVGTGNLAGVASAIAIGGPGAVFWMWVIALIGSATAFVESTLAQLFKQKHKDSFIGGPAYYIQRGLHQRWMAIFSVDYTSGGWPSRLLFLLRCSSDCLTILFSRIPSVVPCRKLSDGRLCGLG